MAETELLPRTPEAIRIDRFIERQFSVTHEYEDLEPGVLGSTDFSRTGVSRIVVATSLDSGCVMDRRRKRATLVHEAGHGLLHAHLFIAGEHLELLEPKKTVSAILCREVVLLGGVLRVRGRHGSGAEIEERYTVRIEVPAHFPMQAPRAFETGGRISQAFYTMQDGSMCLGSPLAVRRALRADPSVLTFVEGLVIPYLFGHASRQRGLPLPFGELEHGRAGLEDELREDFPLQKEDDVRTFLRLAGNRRRVAHHDRLLLWQPSATRGVPRCCRESVQGGVRTQVDSSLCDGARTTTPRVIARTAGATINTRGGLVDLASRACAAWPSSSRASLRVPRQ